MVRRSTLALAVVASVSASQYHGRVMLDAKQAYKHTHAGKAAAATYGEAKVGAEYTAMSTSYGGEDRVQKKAVAYDYKDNTIASVDCVTSEWGDYNHCALLPLLLS